MIINVDTNEKSRKMLLFSIILIIVNMMIVSNTYANELEGEFIAPFCKLMLLLSSTFAKIFATIAIATLGFLCLMGRIQMQTALIVFIGITLIFGAPVLVDFFLSTSDNDSIGAERCKEIVGN